MKEKLVAALLAFFLGWLGVHRFYLGQVLMGFVYLVFFWTFIPAIIAFIDFIMFLVMTDESFDAKYNPGKIRPRVATQGGVNVADELAKFHKLKTDGVITEEEFQKRKSELL